MNSEDGDGVIEDDKYAYRETETLQNGIQDHFLNQLSRSNFLGGGTYSSRWAFTKAERAMTARNTRRKATHRTTASKANSH